MSKAVTSNNSHDRSRFSAIAGWTLWTIFIALWASSVVPFYARGLQLLPDAALQYAGVGLARFGIPFAPPPEDVYDTSFLAQLAHSIVCIGPCVFALIIGCALWRFAISWRTYSRVGMAFRISALIVTLGVAIQSYDLAGKFLYWGLG